MSQAKTLYPRNDVNPKEKLGKPFLLQYAKAAWEDAMQMPDTIFMRAAKKYQEWRNAAMGKQSIDKYKPILGIDEGADESWLNVDFTPRPIVSKFRDIAIAKILERKFQVTATPIDALARGLMDEAYANDKAKILMREAAMQSGDPELMNSPVLQPEPGEAEDLEELEMKTLYSAKLNVAIEAEKGVELVYDQNDFDDKRKKTAENLFDCGVGGYKEWLDENNETKVRDVLPDNLITNFCRKHDFSDLVHIGEVIEEPLVDLSKFFSAEEMEDIAKKSCGKNGNPEFIGDNSTYNLGFDGFKVQVLDLEIKSDDVIVYKKRLDARGNLHIQKDKWEKKDSDATIDVNGVAEKKFVPRTITNIYRIKWIVGTDYCYEYGLAHNMKREPEKKLLGRTTFSYHLYAYNFDNMRAQSMMERLMPSVDDYYLTHIKLQNLKNRMTPNGFAIDLDALESVDLKGSGENMTPMAVLEMLFNTGILVYRGSTLDSTNVNRKPVEPLVNSYAQELVALVNELERIKQEMRDMTGLNEVTDGSTPSDRMLNGVASLANTSTNNALFPLIKADRRLTERTAKGVIQRLQIAVQKGDVEGIIKGLGEGTVKHIRITKNIALHTWGIMIQDVPNDEERQLLLQQLNLKDAQGQVDPEDLITVYNIHNIKEARQYLAYKVKKRKKEAEQKAMQDIQANAQAQKDAAKTAEEEKRKTAEFMHTLKMKEILLTKQWDYKIATAKTASSEAIADKKHETTLTQTAMGHDHDERMNGMPDENDMQYPGMNEAEMQEAASGMEEAPAEETMQEQQQEMPMMQ